MLRRQCSLLVNLDLKVKTKLKTGEEARSASVSEWIWHNIDDDRLTSDFHIWGGSFFFMMQLSTGLTIYPPIWDPQSGSPLDSGQERTVKVEHDT